MKAKLKNLLSRKFLLTLLTTLSGIATALSGVGGEAGTISGVALAIIPTITYIVTEGKLDKEAIKMMLESAENVIDSIGSTENTESEKK